MTTDTAEAPATASWAGMQPTCGMRDCGKMALWWVRKTCCGGTCLKCSVHMSALLHDDDRFSTCCMCKVLHLPACAMVAEYGLL